MLPYLMREKGDSERQVSVGSLDCGSGGSDFGEAEEEKKKLRKS